PGQMLTTLIHELHHERQLKAGVMKSVSDKVPSPVEQMWYERAMEADAQATATDISWKLKEAGKPAAWKALEKDGHWRGQVAKAYADKAAGDPKSVENGTAKRAAFDAWFSAKNRFGITTPMIYNNQATNNLPSPTDFEELHRAGLPFEPLKPKDIEKLGDIAPQNYLKAPGGRSLDDPLYRTADFNQWQASKLNFLHGRYEEIKQGNYPKPNMSHPSITGSAAPIAKQQPPAVSVSLARRPAGMKL
ncbi:MAG TPA: DUF6782 family putative metallopeptidase, partial [Patescibacteria group bacterium]|nr:DUF6782 family putative metallopeptidase [Patescibacteria group bacterium]